MAVEQSFANVEDVDGKRLRKNVTRITVNHRASIALSLRSRVWQRGPQDRRALQPDALYCPQLLPPSSYLDNPVNSVTTRFIKSAMSKERCPIFSVAWMSQGKRLLTGSSSGEFTIWNGLTFNFETIMQAHDGPIRSMVWSHDDRWMISGDNSGYVKYWQNNLNCVKVFKAHAESLRGISFAPSDTKFVTCSDDGTLGVWDFLNCQKERVLVGHGSDVRCVQWHPNKSLIISGSKESQLSIKLWDPRSKDTLMTIHAHKAPVTDLKWNQNGNWLVSASRDQQIKLFDLRKLDQEILSFRGHKSEVTKVAWHPMHEGLLSSAAFDGSIMFWHADDNKELGSIDQAHNGSVWSLAWHPVGHILCSGSNDHSTKFWTRNRPGDKMDDSYNCNNLPVSSKKNVAKLNNLDETCIPLLDSEDKAEDGTICNSMSKSNVVVERKLTKQTVYPGKPIPVNFLRKWYNPTSSRAEVNILPKNVANENLPMHSNGVPPEQTCSNSNKENELDDFSIEQLLQAPPPDIPANNYIQNNGNHRYDDYNDNGGCNGNYIDNYDDHYNSDDISHINNFHHENNNYNGNQFETRNTTYQEENYDVYDEKRNRNSSRGNNYRNHRASNENESQKFKSYSHHRMQPYQRPSLFRRKNWQKK